MKFIVFIGGLVVSLAAFAGENYNYPKEQAAKKYQLEMCIASNRNVCIDQICLNSEEIDCHENCAEIAKKTCATR